MIRTAHFSLPLLLLLAACGDTTIHLPFGGNSASHTPTRFLTPGSPGSAPAQTVAITATPLVAPASSPAGSAAPGVSAPSTWDLKAGNGETLCSELQRWAAR